MKHKVKGKRASSNDQLIEYLQASIEPNCSLLDLGCGPKLYSNAVKDRCARILTVDAWAWVEPDVVADLETVSLDQITRDRWDYILMLDFVEHLDKSSAKRLLDQCCAVVDKKIFVLTPLQSIWTDNHEHVEDPRLWCYGNEYDLHKSLWTPEDFPGWTQITLPSLQNYYVGYYAV